MGTGDDVSAAMRVTVVVGPLGKGGGRGGIGAEWRSVVRGARVQRPPRAWTAAAAPTLASGSSTAESCPPSH
mgnify:CR=1 FL=1